VQACNQWRSSRASTILSVDAVNSVLTLKELATKKELPYSVLEFFLIKIHAMDLNDEAEDADDFEDDDDAATGASGGRVASSHKEYLASQLLRRLGAGRVPFGDVLLRSKKIFFETYDFDGNGNIDMDEWHMGLDAIDANLSDAYGARFVLFCLFVLVC
jgi:hypothetical protein